MRIVILGGGEAGSYDREKSILASIIESEERGLPDILGREKGIDVVNEIKRKYLNWFPQKKRSTSLLYRKRVSW